uniref:Methionyl-tRNA formyltransferase n=1 Tax=Thermorudis peleae TaxID=1382356 RepID=A0A831TA99_9BACT
MVITIVFFGTSEFAVPILQSLASDSRFTVSLVVTQPDRPAGRGQRLMPPPVKKTAQEMGLPVFQPESLRAPGSRERLEQVVADIYVVAAYGEILPKSILRLPLRGAVNVHPSLLPRYRGASPVQAAILNGDEETGITIIEMTARMDAGPILAQIRVPIAPRETAGELLARLAVLASQTLPDLVERYARGDIVPIPQDETQASYTRPLTKEDARIDWSKPGEEIERLVRAMQPWPRAWTMVDGRRLIVTSLDISHGDYILAPGQIHVDQDRLLVGTGSVPVILQEVVPEGRKSLSAIDWWRGARLTPDARFT